MRLREAWPQIGIGCTPLLVIIIKKQDDGKSFSIFVTTFTTSNCRSLLQCLGLLLLCLLLFGYPSCCRWHSYRASCVNICSLLSVGRLVKSVRFVSVLCLNCDRFVSLFLVIQTVWVVLPLSSSSLLLFFSKS